ncbi:metallophosphoesterase [Prevotella melaninogenica]|uniref:metallophosphoesterase n=1 Tax=Prevotella melaninogenica TaxID=28132 RepID=UPI001C60378A|nr:metallophosphoesterase [Prevotella melaninogenica]MBW4740691.1 metallophosphoesterase [Prevotella melaninogenica]MBW4912392.1 metallophosphoesterase [Prevotella melaninogenica]
MIARIVIYLILIIVLSDLYIDMHYFRKRYPIAWWKRLLWWLPSIGMVIYTCAMASIRDFAPNNLTWLNTYIFLLGLLVGPKAIFALTSFLGSIIRRYIIRTNRNWGHYIGILLGCFAVGTFIYGLTYGVSNIQVKHVDLYFKDLPKSFDGYRIVHVSDLHLGTFNGWRSKILKAEMDSIEKQKANLICFTGDLQNIRPEEVEKMASVIRQPMKGTISVLGNHDYTEYIKGDAKEKAAEGVRLINAEEKNLKWTLLRNQNTEIISPAKESIYVCGTENDGRPPFPNYSNYRKAMQGIEPNSFVIMLQHDPSAWKRSILPKTTAQLTLSGHTHGGQMQIFGWRPTSIRQQEDYGLYEQNGRYLYITAGLGGLVPFRLNMPNEIAVITLHVKN